MGEIEFFGISSISNILGVISLFSFGIIIYKILSDRRGLFMGDVFLILILLIFSAIICILSLMIHLNGIDDCVVPAFISIFSDISLFMWNFLLVYFIYHHITFKTILKFKHWAISISIGYFFPLVLAITGWFLSILGNNNKEQTCWIIHDTDEKREIGRYYALSIYGLQVILYLGNIYFYNDARRAITTENLTPIELYKVKRFMLAMRFVVIHFVVFIFALINRIFSIFSFVPPLEILMILIYNSLGIIYLAVFMSTYVFRNNIYIDEGSFLNSVADRTVLINTIQ